MVGSNFEDKYLGLPTPKGSMKVDKLQTTFMKCGDDSSEKFLSFAAKEN